MYCICMSTVYIAINDWPRIAFYLGCDWLTGVNNIRHVYNICGCKIRGCILIRTRFKFVQRVYANSTRWFCGTKGSSSSDRVCRCSHASFAPPSRCLHPPQPERLWSVCFHTHPGADTCSWLNESSCLSSTAPSMSPFPSSAVANFFSLHFSESYSNVRSTKKYW